MLNTLTVQETIRLTMTHKRGFRSLRSLQPCLSTPLVSKNSLVPEVLRNGVHQPRRGSVGVSEPGVLHFIELGKPTQKAFIESQREVPR